MSVISYGVALKSTNIL